MRKLFPEMNEVLRKGWIFCIFVYMLFGLGLFPNLIPLVAYGLWDELQVTAWVELIYHFINFLVLLAILKEHLTETFLTVQIDLRVVARTVLIALGLMLLWVMICWVTSVKRFGQMVLLEYWPVCEMSVALSPGLFVEELPVMGTLCMAALMPFTVTGLFYASSFAPVSYRHPLLAYLVVAVVRLIPMLLFDILWRGQADFVLTTYVLSLPIHWFACWSYQKTDCAWAPIFSLGIFNLLLSLANIFL